MSLRITNSLTRTKQDLIPIHHKTINMYSCGVTVYDRCHIGHARSLYVFDMIRRYLKYRGFNVVFVRNITDIDDKIIAKAKETKKSAKQVAQENIQLYYEDLKALGIERADVEPKATENIPDMICHVQKLIELGYAYVVEGEVYFSVRSFKDYGRLSGQSVENMYQAVRVEQEANKKDPLDFVLWKRSKEGEPSWESPWGHGRPGWHIECSVMSMKHLHCQTLDIHAGGRDLIFPHHENEVAQAEAATKQPFAKYWIHHGLLTINGQKMSKSLGNFITIKDALSQYGVNALKLFFLSSHYSSSIDFSDAKMQETIKNIERFLIFRAEAKRVDCKKIQTSPQGFPEVERYLQEFLAVMDDDFNTPRALSCVFEMINRTYQAKNQENFDCLLISVHEMFNELFREIFGISFDETDQGLSADDQHLLSERAQARLNKDFKRSDELRNHLKERGIIVQDGPQGQTWRRER
jgi:cysteinyl-tRNA synthetase